MAFFEVGKGPSIHSAILRLTDLAFSMPKHEMVLYLMVADAREKDVQAQLSRPAIRAAGAVIHYILFSELRQHCKVLYKFSDSPAAMRKIARAMQVDIPAVAVPLIKSDSNNLSTACMTHEKSFIHLSCPMKATPPAPLVEMGLDIEKMEKVAFILKTTAHPTRIAIVQLLAAHDSLAVGDICERLGGAEQSLTSHHLAAMKNKGLLSSSRSGKNIYYSLKMREVIDVIQCLAACTFL